MNLKIKFFQSLGGDVKKKVQYLNFGLDNHCTDQKLISIFFSYPESRQKLGKCLFQNRSCQKM